MHKRILLASASVAVLLGLSGVLPVAGQDASSSASAAAPAAADADVLASGKHIWSDAACSNCHGANAGGGHSADFPASDHCGRIE